jgi:hypothetical protein
MLEELQMDRIALESHRASRAAVGVNSLPNQLIATACPESSPRREALEQYISGAFSAAYDARILGYLPLLFSLEDNGGYRAALGLRSAAVDPLFCEQYLDSTVEEEVRSLYRVRVGRSKIMEMGNLVASAGHSALLYLIVTAAMHEAGIEYLLFAANKSVRTSINRSGFTPKLIRLAEKNCLGEEASNWGSYYEGDPIVMLADIELTMQQAMTQPKMRKILAGYRHDIAVLADAIRNHIP